MQDAFYGLILVALGLTAVVVLVRRNSRAEAASRAAAQVRDPVQIDAERNRAYFSEHFEKGVNDIRASVSIAQSDVWCSLKCLREKKKLLEASMREVETFLVGNAEFFTGSQLTSAEQEANLRLNEHGFVKALQSVQGAVKKVRELVLDANLKAMHLEIWLQCGVSDEVRGMARALISDVSDDSFAVTTVMDSVLCEADKEPVGDDKEPSNTVDLWRQARAMERRIYMAVISAPQ